MNFNFKKKFGQNFLQDKNVIRDIVQAINPGRNDLVIEIGPGAGALTKLLSEIGCNVLCYEIDVDAHAYLDKYETDHLKVVYDDFLNRDIKSDIKDIRYDNLYIIGNLPYYITTPIIMHIIESQLLVKEMVFMVQKEVAVRFSALPGSSEYGSISVFLNYFFDIRKLFIVNRSKFYPVPNVDSAVIKFIAKNNSLDVDFNKFNRIVKDAFRFKRKNIRNNMKEYDLVKLESILSLHGFSLSSRAEELSYEVFVDIANKY